MLTNLISIESFTIEDWQSLLDKCCDEITYKLLEDRPLEKDKTVQFECSGSLCGFETLLQSNGLKIFLNAIPSRKDFRLYCKVIEASSKSSAVFSDSEQVDKLKKSDSFNESFADVWNSAVEQKAFTIVRQDRKINLEPWLKLDLQATDQEADLLKKISTIADAKEPEVFPIDEKLSAIWDGKPTWIGPDIEQVLFSQNYFKGKICGEINAQKLAEILDEKIISSGHGFVLPEARKLSGGDIRSLNESLIHYEKREIKKKLEKLTIEAGKLEEISYIMSRTLFEGMSLSKITEKYIKDGISKAQLEVAALAVSGMLEIAATSQGKGLDHMQNRLKDKCKLSAEAAYAVANGFVNAAKEVNPNKKKVNWMKLGILLFSVGTVIWFIFFR
ncbi:MAG: hypothetical protein NE327_10520 [Lentisphaeraceae bacterium]|nr:hypothetical protein [Lentisphaeraceae bacterium]